MELETLQQSLNRIQKELKAPKGQRNTFGNYNYRSCEDILEAVKPLLGDKTLLITDEIVLIGDRYYVKATASISNGEASIITSAMARESLDKKGMDTAQITGATSSYARKYALNGLFCIDDTKDADSTNEHKEENIPEPQYESQFGEEPFDGSKPAEQQRLPQAGVCEKCGAPMAISKSTGKPYCSSKCWLKQ